MSRKKRECPRFSQQNLVAQGYLLGWRFVGRMPHRWMAKLAVIAADKVSNKGKGMEQLRKNLTRVVGAENVTAELVRDAMRSYARYWLEAFRLPQLVDDPGLIATIERGIEGIEYLEASQSQQKGTVLVAAHSGNWDMAGMFYAHRYGTFTTVAERLKPVELFDAFVRFRTKLGFQVLSHSGTGGSKSTISQLAEVLTSGGTVCLLGDRDLKGTGVEVDFFGEKTTMPTGAARLAVETGADLLVVHCWFEGTIENPGWGLKISPPVPPTTVAQMVQAQADIMAENIAAHPQDWHVLQPLWLADRKKKM